MLTFDDIEVKDKIHEFNNLFKKGGGSILWFDKYISRVLRTAHETAIASGKLKYPIEIKIPKPMSELLKGDFEPARIIRINEPMKFGDAPIWWADSSKGVTVRVGNQNGDSRKPSQFSLNDKDIHAVLGGITGMGKSVTLNSIIFGMAFEYAPWELNMTLLDAKAADIKRFGRNPLPHISAIAATKDTDYILSVLREKKEEMVQMQSVITLAGCGKLEDFREKTGLCIPQNVITTDEFQTLFKNAKKKLNEVIDLYDDYSRLGRSAGYHLIMASQELGSDVPKATLNQWGVRMCLGATAAVSEQILGNDDSKNIRTKGKLNVNMNPEGHNATENIEFKVPFQPSDGSNDQFTPQSAFLMQLGDSCNFIRERSFYDENSVVYEDEYEKYISKFSGGPDKIYLGEPSFVMRDEEQVVRMEFNREDYENILVLNQNITHLERYGRMIKYNLKRSNVLNIVLNADDTLYNKIGLKDIQDLAVDVRSIQDPNYNNILSTVFNRKLMMDVDKAITRDATFNAATDAVIINEFGDGSHMFTRTNRSRAYYIDGYCRNDYKDLMGLSRYSGQELDRQIDSIIIDCLKLYDKYGVSDRPITPDVFPATYIWVVGLQRIQGIGRDSKSGPVSQLKQVMFDSCLVNVRFILLASNIDDTAELLKAVKYAIYDNADNSQINKIKAGDYYPEIIPKQLGVLINTTDKTALKFKKMFLQGEILG